MNLLDTLEDAEAAPQGLARLQVLKLGDSPELRAFLKLALSSEITFGMRKVPEPSGVKDPVFFSERYWFDITCSLLDRMEKRLLTGNDAQDEISSFLGFSSPVQRKWTERVIRQDLRLNIGAKEVNKIFPGCIWEFSVPLATDYTKVKAKDLAGSWYIEPKLDGARCVARLEKLGGPVTLLSRTGKVWTSFGSIQRTLEAFNQAVHRDEDLYLDGEVVSFVGGKIDFNAIQQVLHRDDGKEIGQLAYLVFDAAIGDEWKSPKMKYGFRKFEVSKVLHQMHKTVTSDNVREVPHTEVLDPSPESLFEACGDMVSQGYEGAMARRSDLPVTMKRSKTLLKVKVFSDMEAEVTGVVEGTGKLVGMLGALKARTAAGVDFEIGTGLDDATRADLWNRRLEIVGAQATLKFFELSKDGVPRFPVFKGMRHSSDIGA